MNFYDVHGRRIYVYRVYHYESNELYVTSQKGVEDEIKKIINRIEILFKEIMDLDYDNSEHEEIEKNLIDQINYLREKAFSKYGLTKIEAEEDRTFMSMHF